MITIFGATGHTGGTAANHLLKAGKKVRVVGRHKDKLASLQKAGAEASVGDIEDKAFVRDALKGAEGAYVLIPPHLTTDDFRGYQGRIADSLSSGVEAAGVRYVVLLSSIGAHHKQGTGPIVGVHEFEGRLRKIAGLNTLFLRAGYFMENVFMNLALVRSQGIFPGTMPPSAGMDMIASADVGAYAGRRLERLDFAPNTVIHLIGPRKVSQSEIATILSGAIGKPVQYVQVSPQDVQNGMQQAGLSKSVIDVFIEMDRAGGQGLVAPEEGGPVERAPTTFETFAKDVFAPAYRAG